MNRGAAIVTNNGCPPPPRSSCIIRLATPVPISLLILEHRHIRCEHILRTHFLGQQGENQSISFLLPSRVYNFLNGYLEILLCIHNCLSNTSESCCRNHEVILNAWVGLEEPVDDGEDCRIRWRSYKARPRWERRRDAPSAPGYRRASKPNSDAGSEHRRAPKLEPNAWAVFMADVFG